MKKIITLFATVLLVTASFAQYNNNQRNDGNSGRKDEAYNRRPGNDRDHDNNRYTYSNRQRDMQLAQINREYDRRIESVQHRRFLSRSKKEAMICSLQNQRRDELRTLYENFNRRNGNADDRDRKRHW